MKISEELESVLCDASGKACVGTEDDNKVIDDALFRLWEMEVHYEELKSEIESLKKELEEWRKYEH
jgi:uncharacterized membrane protein